MTSPTSVVVNDVHVTYEALADRGRRRRARTLVPALAGVDFKLHEGDALGLIGRNGCGKSTLMQVVAGLIPVSSGNVAVASQPQFLGVRAALNTRLSGRNNIKLGCLALGIEASKIDDVRDSIEEFSELGSSLDLPVRAYSAGMRQRLAFSISIVARPQILLIDEALAVGDQTFRQKCFVALEKVKQDAGTIILASHAMREIRATCNRAIWLEAGAVKMAGEADEVSRAYVKSRNA